MNDIDSILDSVKKLISITNDDDSFDLDMIVHINTTFAILRQLGVGPQKGFTISDNTKTWTEYMQGDFRLEMVKTYVFLKAQLFFDPPLSATLLEAKKGQIDELEFRLNSIVDYEPLETEENQNG